MTQLAPLSQGVFYVAAGLWPLVHLRSFEAVTGRKVDRWLVKTTGGLIAAVGAALVAGTFERRSRALKLLGVGSALALAAADLVYVGKRRIRRVYLGDALVELGWVGAWLLAPRAS